MPGRLTERQTGVLLAASGVLLISLDSLWIRLSEVGSWDVAFWVGVFTFTALTLTIQARPGPSLVEIVRRDGKPLLLSAVLNTLSVTFFILAVGATSVANTVAIIASTPVAAAVAARILIGEKPLRRTWVGIAGTVLGILIIVSGSIGAGTIGGDSFAVMAVVAFAGNVALWRRHPGISRSGVFAMGGLLIAIITFVPAAPLSVDWRALLILAAMGGVTGPLGRVCLASATRYLPAAQVGLFTPIETIAATTWAFLFLGEVPPELTVAGGVVVIVSVMYGTGLGPHRLSRAPRE